MNYSNDNKTAKTSKPWYSVFLKPVIGTTALGAVYLPILFGAYQHAGAQQEKPQKPKTTLVQVGKQISEKPGITTLDRIAQENPPEPNAPEPLFPQAPKKEQEKNDQPSQNPTKKEPAPYEQPPAQQNTPEQEHKPADDPLPEPTPNLLQLPSDLRVLNEIIAASRKSTQVRRDYLSLRIPYGELTAQALSEKYKDKGTEDKIKETGFGAYAQAEIADFVTIGAGFSQNTLKRKSNDRDATQDANFRITTNTETLEEAVRAYAAAKLGLDFDGIRAGMTLYQDTTSHDIDVITLLEVINRNDPAGNYTDTILNGFDFENKTQGLLLTGERDLFFPGTQLIEKITIGATGGMERTEIELDSRKLDVYRLDAFATATGKNNTWALSAGLGDRLFDDGEDESKLSTAHWYVAGAANLRDGLNVYGAFHRLEEPAGKLGFILGRGNAVPLLVNYNTRLAQDALGLIREMGPEERKAYLNSMHYDLLRGLSKNCKEMRLLVEAGLERHNHTGEAHYFTGEIAGTIPAGDFVFIPSVRLERSENGMEKKKTYSLRMLLGDGWKFGAEAGKMEFKDRKDKNAPFAGISIEKDF